METDQETVVAKPVPVNTSASNSTIDIVKEEPPVLESLVEVNLKKKKKKEKKH